MHPVIFLRRDLNARLIQILVKHTVEVIVVTEFLKWRFMCNEHQLQIRCGTPILHIVNNCLSDIFKQRKNQWLICLVLRDLNTILFPLYIVKFQSNHIADPNSKPGNQQNDCVIPFTDGTG